MATRTATPRNTGTAPATANRGGPRRNGADRRRSNTRPAKLSQRGVAVVAVTVAVAVLLAGNGHAGLALAIAVAAYVLVGGGASAVAKILPDARQVLRGLSWAAVAGAVLMASQGTTAPGGATLGLALAAALATALRLTRRAGRR